MKSILKIWLVFDLFGCYMVSAQNPEEEVLKKLVMQETETFLSLDFEVWKSLYIHDENTSITVAGKDRFEDYMGWKAIESGLGSVTKRPSAKIEQKNIYVKMGDNMAWMRFDRDWTYQNTSKTYIDRMFYTFEKQDGQWKIRTSVCIHSSTFKSFKKQ